MIDVLIILIVVILPQCKHISSHHIVSLKYTIFICQVYLNKAGRKRNSSRRNKVFPFPSKVRWERWSPLLYVVPIHAFSSYLWGGHTRGALERWGPQRGRPKTPKTSRMVSLAYLQFSRPVGRGNSLLQKNNELGNTSFKTKLCASCPWPSLLWASLSSWVKWGGGLGRACKNLVILGEAVIKDHFVLWGLTRTFIQDCLILQICKTRAEEISNIHTYLETTGELTNTWWIHGQCHSEQGDHPGSMI